MAEQFGNQGGVANMNPPAPLRWVSSKVMSRMGSMDATRRRRQKAERARRKSGAPHRIDYFHQVEDGYSHLAAQLLLPLVEHYEVELACHLVGEEPGRNLPEPQLLLELSRYDAGKVAPHYGLRFPEKAQAPAGEDIARATQILAAAPQSGFASAAVAVGDALFSGNSHALAALGERLGSVDTATANGRILDGNGERARRKHYSGAMFHYAGEWFWGADRFYHLEKQLVANGARKTEGGLLCPRPAIESGPLKDSGSLTLEVYPSLRSPYTSIIFDRAMQLAADTGVRLVVRPVLPMVMRGVPATQAKGRYIVSDTAREADELGVRWGRIYDPIGDPVRNCYSLYPWACKHGKGNELLSQFLRAAFIDGVNTNNDAGMRQVVEKCGLPWDEAKSLMGNTDWEEEIEANRLAMYGFGSWGVPSFSLLDASGAPVLGLWGQDRLWLFSREIQRLLREAASDS